MLKSEKMFFIYGVVVILITAVGIFYSLVFISTQMFNAFAVDEASDEEVIFDFESFEQLGL